MESYTEASVAVLTLAQSDSGNRLNSEMLQSLLSALHQAVDSQDVRIILIRSSGAVFSQGMDLGLAEDALSASGGDDAANDQASGWDSFERGVGLYSELLWVIHSAPKPVVCVVAGETTAGGVGLVCACDIVFATPEASFTFSEVLFGLVPANVLPYVIGVRIPLQKARYLVLSSKCVGAEEALRLNIVDEVMPAASMETGLRNLIKRLLRSSPGALAEAKHITRQLAAEDFDSGRRIARESLVRLMRQGDALSAAHSFAEGETPVWFKRYKPERRLFEEKQP